MTDTLLEARAQARQAQREREAWRKQAHGKVAVLLRGKRTGPVVVCYALKQVAKWRNKGLCSRDYIDSWSALLRRPKEAAALLLEDSPRAVRLRQNSPFAAYLDR
ncbi:hypothetical protein [Microvirgula curvata]